MIEHKIEKAIVKPEYWVLLASLIAVIPLAAVVLAIMLLVDLETPWFWTLLLLVLSSVIWSIVYLQRKVIYSLRSISNSLLSLKESDYSVRLALNEKGEAIDEIVHSVNALRDILHEERTGAAETGALFSKVVEKIDVALFAFDIDQRCCMANNRGLHVLGLSRQETLGQTADHLGLIDCLELQDDTIQTLSLNGVKKNCLVRRAQYREFGHPRELIILSDLTQPLRQQEREAWQRLISVLRHEISNALAPIQSYSQTLSWTLKQDEKPSGWENTCSEGLMVIERQTASLNKMMQSYKGLSQIPKPEYQLFSVLAFLQEVVVLDQRMAVQLHESEDVEINADKALLTQVLLNVIKNAIDATQKDAREPLIVWSVDDFKTIRIDVEDFGTGISNIKNLFVPFFTTKTDGSGIGLLVCRQIIEMHQGQFTLNNKTDDTGSLVSIYLPLEPR